MSFFRLYQNIVDYVGSSPQEMRSVIYTSSIEHNEEDEREVNSAYLRILSMSLSFASMRKMSRSEKPLASTRVIVKI